MRSLRIKGVVRLTDSIRMELTRAHSPHEKNALRRRVEQSLRRIDQILAEHRTRVEALPGPTRRAYAFLKGIDFDAIGTFDAPRREADSRPAVSFPGLWTHWQRILDAQARANPPDGCHVEIRSTSETIERMIEVEGIEPADLSERSRQARGWLAFFADPDNFQLYVDAVRRARGILGAACARSPAFRAPALVRFQPMGGLYRWRLTPTGTSVAMPTPMCTFSDALFEVLADSAIRRSSRRTILEATAADEYQALQAEIEARGGIVQQGGGVHRDLAVVFERVNRRYFDGTQGRPRLTWSASFTHRKFGHYDLIRDTVMISRTLDDANVPEFVIDFVMYHELLHKKLGVRWHRGKLLAHTPEFRTEERRFSRFEEAEAQLRRLATDVP
jgi:hypothetical protein